ncbi:fluoride efflux transporter CrcB [Martelella endophytica]|uniref:Fluoride-specific ion channel FluC n=1 Tax=Martelella endophytica TaxID=1486262 RepID=A0A0D5LRH3_MAREN|nr:fluoride efflux transporter CrcB [Martelella endophytica]AJY46839.1 camphor resistance protein CrcB [Martelella endophytica]
MDVAVPQILSHALIVAAGGALGASGRYLVGVASVRMLGYGFPWGTFIVNVVGSLMIGLLVELVARVLNQSADMRMFLVTGFLGGFTTFSSFSLDAMNMIERGDFAPAAVYVISSVVLGLFAVFAGLAIGRMVF